jgi:D-3-phosphoglycerate dehydrogenase
MKPVLLSSLDINCTGTILNKLKKNFKIIVKTNSSLRFDKFISTCDIYLASAAIRVDKDFLKKATKLKVILSPSTGVDHLDINEIKKKNIKLITITKEIKLLETFSATSEIAFALILNLYRNIIPANKSALNGIWAREKFSGRQLLGKTIGILGLGRLGVITARIALGFGMKVVAYDIKKKNIKGVKMLSMNKLFKMSDIVSVHVHLNSKTAGLIDRKFLTAMKKNSILINTSRGAIINEKDLLHVLKRKIIAGAGLDIINGEWLSKKELLEHKLINYARKNNNLIILPHIGGSTIESIVGARIFICNKLLKNYKIYLR